MKILNLSDIHIKETPPRNRIDKYYEKQFEKLEWAIDLGNKNNCEVLLQAGDLVHTVRASNKSQARILRILKKFNGKIFSIFGQHDIYYHVRNIENTPSDIFESAGVISFLSKNPVRYKNIDIYGCSYGENIPEIQDEKRLNILVIHKMIVKEKLWEAQEDFVYGYILLRKHSFDLILSGDNHNLFTESFMNRHLLNLGSMMRMTSLQVDHFPSCAIFDTEKKEFDLIKIPIEDASNVFDLSKLKEEAERKEENQKIREYIETLVRETESEDINFKNNVIEFIEKNKIKEEISQIMLQHIEGVK